MFSLDDISLRGKLFLSFLAGGGVLTAAIVFCLFQIRSLGGVTQEIADYWLPAVQQAAEISQLRLRYRVRSLEFMLAESDGERAKIEASIGSLDKSLDNELQKYERLITGNKEDETEHKILHDTIAGVETYRHAVQEALALAKSGRMEEAQELRRTVWVKAADNVRDQVDALVAFNRSRSEKVADQAELDVKAAMQAGYLALFVGIIVSIVATLWMVRNLNRRLSAAVAAANRISGGDLTGMLPVVSKDEIGQLIASMTDMQQALRTAMLENRGNAGDILACSIGLKESVDQMKQSASVQSGVASAIAANVEEMTVSINHISGSTGEAARFAQDSDHKAREGHDRIETLVASIGDVAHVIRAAAEQIARLESESEKISNIVAVIRDVSDQTNLLALNAAIEAARAGEQGRGFAVVADEVRKLSERTALSTNEIAAMIAAIQHSTHSVVAEVGQSVAQVDQSVAGARLAGEAIASLQEMARKVARIIAEVDEALQEQSAASNDVAKRVEEVATQAEEASSIAQRTSQAAESMSQTAHGMQQLVARFRL